MAIGSASNRIMAPRPHMSTPHNRTRNPHAEAPAKGLGTDLLLFTGRRPKWAIIGALSVMTMDWQDF